MRQILSMVFISVCCVCVDQEAPQEAEVLYEDAVLFFDETRKWRDRYLVVRANYCLECHDSLEVSATTRIDYTLPELSFTAFFFFCRLVRLLLKEFLHARSCCLQGAPFWPPRRSTCPWWTSVSPTTPVSERLNKCYRLSPRRELMEPFNDFFVFIIMLEVSDLKCYLKCVYLYLVLDHRLIIRMISASDVSVVKTGQQMLSRREPPQRTSFSRKEIILCCLHTNMLSKCLSSSRRIKRRANRAASHSKHIILQINLQNKKKMTSFIIIYHHVPLHIQLDVLKCLKQDHWACLCWNQQLFKLGLTFQFSFCLHIHLGS